MAIVLMKEPRKDSLDINDWDRLVLRTTYQGSGFICIEVDNINTGEKPKVKLGGSFNFGYVFYNVEMGDEDVSGTPTNGVENFVYAVGTSDGKVSLQFSKDQPTWDAAYGGWYADASRRALVKFFYVDGKYNNKVILDSYNAMFMVNTKQVFDPPADSGGVPVDIPGINPRTSTKPVETSVNLLPGIYRYSLKGGDGGDKGDPGMGGNGGASAGSGTSDGPLGYNGENGNPGNPATPVVGIFIHHGGPIRVVVGAKGGKGGAGGKGGTGFGYSGGGVGNGQRGGRGGNGGGGGAGQDSHIGGIIARGGDAGFGKDVQYSSKNYQGSSPGGFSFGGNGANGETLFTEGTFGLTGERPSTVVGGSAQIWRLG